MLTSWLACLWLILTRSRSSPSACRLLAIERCTP
jgi:hypothetical protein